MTEHYSEKLLGLLYRINEFLRTNAYPLESDFLRLPFRELTPTLNATREKVKALGLWAPHLPEVTSGSLRLLKARASRS